MTIVLMITLDDRLRDGSIFGLTWIGEFPGVLVQVSSYRLETDTSPMSRSRCSGDPTIERACEDNTEENEEEQAKWG